jgi:hypothetical protein
MFADDRDGKIPPVRENTDGTWSHLQANNHEARWFLTGETHWNLGLLWKYGYAKDGEIFYCPSRLAFFRYEDYSDPVFPTEVLGGGWGVRVPYSYNPICKSLDNRERLCKNMIDFKVGRSLLLVDVLRPGGVAHVNGWNVARGDLSVAFVIDPTIIDDMENTTENFVNQDFETWDRIMDKFRR